MPKNRKLSNSAAKANKAAKAAPAPATEAKAAPAPVRMHENVSLTYAGASPTVRGHGRKLAAIRTDIGAAKITERDESFIRDLRAVYRDKPFKRLDTDAGCVRRAIAHKFITISGDVSSRDAVLTITSLGLSYGAKA